MRLIQQRVRPQGRTFNRESFLRSTEVVPGLFVSEMALNQPRPQFFSRWCLGRGLLLPAESTPGRAMTIYLCSAGQ